MRARSWVCGVTPCELLPAAFAPGHGYQVLQAREKRALRLWQQGRRTYHQRHLQAKLAGEDEIGEGLLAWQVL